jgi:hypothetical protein
MEIYRGCHATHNRGMAKVVSYCVLRSEENGNIKNGNFAITKQLIENLLSATACSANFLDISN